MDNLDFLKEAKIWFFGTILGTIFSAIGIIAESKIPIKAIQKPAVEPNLATGNNAVLNEMGKYFSLY